MVKRFVYKRKSCWFCDENLHYVDYKHVDLLGRFIALRGKITPSRVSGNCWKHQRILARAIKRARIVALLPFTTD